MAYERLSDATKTDSNVKILGDGLDAFVNSAIALFKQQVTVRDNQDESKLQELVLAGNMSLDDQLNFRKGQLKYTEDDPDTRAKIRQQISAITAQITQKKFSDDYTKKLQDHGAGIASIQSIVDWLKNQLVSTSDLSVKDKINSELVTQQNNLFTATQNMLKDQTDYALRDKGVQTITDQLTKLGSARNTALLSGDEATAANLNLQIQSLQQTQKEAQVTRDMQNFAVATVSGASSATHLLDSYNSKISSSNTTTPFTINGTTYANEQQYWTYTRDSYLADRGSSGFFSRIDSEVKDSLKDKYTNNTLSIDDLKSANSQFAILAARPELGAYSALLDTAKADSLQSAGDLFGKSIEDSYQNNIDLNKAVNALGLLKSQGVNVDDTMQKILTSASATQAGTVQNILTAARDMMTSNPNLSISDAVTQAVKQGAGTVVSPKDILSTPPADSATKILGSTTADKSNTLTPGAPGSSTPSAAIDYSKHFDESIDQYNARIAAARGGEPPIISSSVSPAVIAPPQSSGAGGPPKSIDAGGALGTLTLENIPGFGLGYHDKGTNDFTNFFSIQDAQKQFATQFPTAQKTAAPTPAPTPASAPAPSAPTATPAPAPTPKPSTPASTATPIDYTKHASESIDAYNTRIAAARAAASPTPASATTPVATPVPSPSSPTASSGTYTIKSGDTLGAIAAQHNTTVDALAKLNSLADPNKIQSGLVLKLQ